MTIEIGRINGYTCIKAMNEYILDTEGDPICTEQDAWDDIFGDATPAEIDAELHVAAQEELDAINSAGIRAWMDAKKGNDMEQITINVQGAGWTDGSGWSYTEDLDSMTIDSMDDLKKAAEEYAREWAESPCVNCNDYQLRFYAQDDEDYDHPLCKLWLSDYAPGAEPAVADPQASAAALYDGGWRSADRDQLISEYDLTSADADKICTALAESEANA